MKPSCTSSTIIFRNRNIEISGRKLRATGQYGSLSEIAQVIADAPTSLHFISYQMARLVYYKYIDSEYPQTTSNRHKKMLYDSFLAHCRRIRAQHPDMPMPLIIRQAILSPAPTCGIDAQAIRKILKKCGFK